MINLAILVDKHYHYYCGMLHIDRRVSTAAIQDHSDLIVVAIVIQTASLTPLPHSGPCTGPLVPSLAAANKHGPSTSFPLSDVGHALEATWSMQAHQGPWAGGGDAHRCMGFGRAHQQAS